jgi:hypothetical protein
MRFALTTANLFAQRTKSLVTEGALVVMPAIDEAQARRAMELAVRRSQADGLLLVVLDTERVGLVKVHNLIFRGSESPWYGYIAQDAFAGREWLSLALASIQARSAALLGFNDGKWRGQVASFGLVRRDWAQNNYDGDLFYPGYRSHYADVELTLIARDQGSYVYDPEAIMIEADWDKESAGVDAEDRIRYRTRARQGFAGRVKSTALLGLFD